MRTSFWILPLLVLLAACQPTVGPSTQMKLGRPYVIDGHTYYPAYDPTYDKIGEASWYGPGFHGKYTASGETFNQNDLTAAHPTLPMPSLVRVTNLQNGKSIIVRINDRGPFKSNRIIDLSKKAAEQIGLRSTGQVRVQYLKAETEQYMASIQHNNGSTPVEMAQINAQAEQAKTDSVVASTAPPSAGQIIETTDSSTHMGQTVSNAAPVMTVSSGDLIPSGGTNLSDKSGQPVQTATLVKQVWADDNVTMPTPPPAATPQLAKFDPPPVATHEPTRAEQKADAATPEKKPAANAPSKGRFIIQVGSFSAEDNARKLGARLEGIAAVAIDKVDMGEKTWWRVRVGPFPDQEGADGALVKVRDAGLPDARIVRL